MGDQTAVPGRQEHVGLTNERTVGTTTNCLTPLEASTSFAGTSIIDDTIAGTLKGLHQTRLGDERNRSPSSASDQIALHVAQLPHISNELSPTPSCSSSRVVASNFAHTSTTELLTLNVGGKRFRLKSDTLAHRDTNSRLAKLAKLPSAARREHMGTYIPETDDYFFERPPDEAKLLAQYYMSGIVHKPAWMCFELFHNALEFWSIPEQAVGECCRRPVRHHVPGHPGGHGHGEHGENTETEIDQFENLCCATPRRKIWKLFEEPQSSIPAKAISMVSMAFILASLSGLILSSMEEFQVPPSNTTASTDGPRDPIPALVFLEVCCVIWFSVEFAVRLVVCSNKCAFLTTALNLVDAATVIPFYAETCLPLVGVNAESLKRVTGVMLVVRALRVLRVARLFKLARYSSALQIMGDTFRKSAQELSMLVMLLSTGIIFFATILYFLENDIDSGFSSIPASCWWCVVTMTTVGYGDVVPKTAAGKIVATMTSICGIIVLAFPISLIVEKFATAQEQMESTAGGAGAQRNGVPAGMDGVPGTPKVRKVFGGKFGGRRRKAETTTSMNNY